MHDLLTEKPGACGAELCTNVRVTYESLYVMVIYVSMVYDALHEMLKKALKFHSKNNQEGSDAVMYIASEIAVWLQSCQN